MLTGSTVLRVRPSFDGASWEVMEPGSARALLQARDQDAAIRRARTQLANGGTVEVLSADGVVVSTEQVPAPGQRPWWYVRSKPSTWFLLAVVVANALLSVFVYGELFTVSWWLAVVGAVLVLVTVVLFIVSRVSDRKSRFVDH